MPFPYTEALAQQSAKTHLPTSLRTRMLQELPGVVRARARFSAGMVHAEYLGTMDSVLERTISGELDTATGLLELDRSLGSLGYDPVMGKGSVRSHRSYARRKLILDTNLAQAGNYGQWIQNNTDGALALFPCWEYYRAFNRMEPRDWRARWLAAGGTLYEGRMIARKDDPIWTNSLLNRLGTPYPPYDFNSGMRLKPVSREDAERLGAIKADEDVLPAFPDFTAESMAAANLNGGLRRAVEEALGDVAKFDANGVFRTIAPPTWSDLGLSSATRWDPEQTILTPIPAATARRSLNDGTPVTDYNLRPMPFDSATLRALEGRKLSKAALDARLARLPFAVDAVEAPREHWRHADADAYMQVFTTDTGPLAVLVLKQPDGTVVPYFSSDPAALDRLRRGSLIKGEEPQP